jgi:hypothetical protein
LYVLHATKLIIAVFSITSTMDTRIFRGEPAYRLVADDARGWRKAISSFKR